MSYDPYDAPPRERERERRYYREERRDDRGDYLRPSAYQSRDLVPRPREDSDLSVEEVPRHFPPPGYGSRGDVRRARSAEPGYYDDYDDGRSHHSRGDHDRDRDRDHDRRHHRKDGTSVYYQEEERKRTRMLSKQEKIIAAVAGAALAVGGKELFDRREAHDGGEVHRNALTSAALGAAGALAGYQGAEFYNKRASKDEKKSTYMFHKGRNGEVAEYYSDDDEDRDGKEKKGHKNFLESALAAAGLGNAVKALTGKDDDRHSDGRSDGRSRHGSEGSDKKGTNKIQQAAMASLIAGATEAFRVAKQPGGWRGEKAKRVLTVAAGAATIDGLHGEGHSKLALAESVIGSLVGNRLLNGSRKDIEEDKSTGRSRSRSRARSSGGGGGGTAGIAALATAGLGALGAKKLMDNSRDRSRSRRRGEDSDDGGSPDQRRRSRSRSIADTGRRALAKLGFGTDPDEDRGKDRRGSSRRYSDDEGDRDGGRSRRGDRDRGGYDDDDRSYNGQQRDRSRSRSRSRQRGAASGSESDLGDSSEDEKRAKKMRDKRHRH